ncbi:hypothetical protein G6F22_019296 [Rhizopus arrhizus]|nr:hypothetical protein G6F22_019296 [Rhizopus arrhizus]
MQREIPRKPGTDGRQRAGKHWQPADPDQQRHRHRRARGAAAGGHARGAWAALDAGRKPERFAEHSLGRPLLSGGRGVRCRRSGRAGNHHGHVPIALTLYKETEQ